MELDDEELAATKANKFNLEDIFYNADDSDFEGGQVQANVEKYIKENFISKQTIRNKIKELKKTTTYKVGLEEYTINILLDLLLGE